MDKYYEFWCIEWIYWMSWRWIKVVLCTMQVLWILYYSRNIEVKASIGDLGPLNVCNYLLYGVFQSTLLQGFFKRSWVEVLPQFYIEGSLADTYPWCIKFSKFWQEKFYYSLILSGSCCIGSPWQTHFWGPETCVPWLPN